MILNPRNERSSRRTGVRIRDDPTSTFPTPRAATRAGSAREGWKSPTSASRPGSTSPPGRPFYTANTFPCSSRTPRRTTRRRRVHTAPDAVFSGHPCTRDTSPNPVVSTRIRRDRATTRRRRRRIRRRRRAVTPWRAREETRRRVDVCRRASPWVTAIVPNSVRIRTDRVIRRRVEGNERERTPSRRTR